MDPGAAQCGLPENGSVAPADYCTGTCDKSDSDHNAIHVTRPQSSKALAYSNFFLSSLPIHLPCAGRA